MTTASPALAPAATRQGLVSVIIPTFNRADMLEQALNSAGRQTVSPGEVIVVDDGSTDGTARMMSDYASRHPNVRYLRWPANQGADRARQHGFEQSHGEFIAFLDSDDAWDPTHLEYCLWAFRDRPAAVMVFTQYGVMNQDRDVLVPQVKEPRLSGSPVRPLLFKELIAQYSRILYRRAAIVQAGGVPQSVTADDWVLNVRIASRFPNGIVQLPRSTVLNRVHAGNSAGNPGKMRDSLLRSTDQIFDGLPAEWQTMRARVKAINLLHSAVFFWHAGRSAGAWDCLGQAVRTDPACMVGGSFLSTLTRLMVPAPIGQVLRRTKHELLRRRTATS